MWGYWLWTGNKLGLTALKSSFKTSMFIISSRMVSDLTRQIELGLNLKAAAMVWR